MTQDSTGQTTKVAKNKESGTADHPLMSFTAVTTHKSMAAAFVKELIKAGQRMLPDKDLSPEDLLTICHVALDKREHGAIMLEGRHLRGRIGEQLSRAQRYKEPFSLLVLKFESGITPITYDAIVDTLCERMRDTDLMFLFKYRVVLLLPHTAQEAVQKLSTRILGLLETNVEWPANLGRLEMATATFPDPEFHTASKMLDWAEDQIR